MDQQIEQKIVERGQEFFNSISGEAPSIFNKGWWTGKVMDWSMKNEDFKVQLFRFVDVLPYLNTSESLLRHIREYFASSGSEVPSVLRWGAGKAGLGGALTAKNHGRGHPFQHREHGPPVHHRPERQGGDGRAGQTAQGRLRLYRRPARRSLGQRGGKRRLCRRLP